jgi:adenylylsulfate kinase
MYAKARAGQLPHFTGVDDPYEPPMAPEVSVYTQRETPEQSVAQVLAELERRGYSRSGPRGESQPQAAVSLSRR